MFRIHLKMSKNSINPPKDTLYFALIFSFMNFHPNLQIQNNKKLFLKLVKINKNK